MIVYAFLFLVGEVVYQWSGQTAIYAKDKKCMELVDQWSQK